MVVGLGIIAFDFFVIVFPKRTERLVGTAKNIKRTNGSLLQRARSLLDTMMQWLYTKLSPRNSLNNQNAVAPVPNTDVECDDAEVLSVATLANEMPLSEGATDLETNDQIQGDIQPVEVQPFHFPIAGKICPGCQSINHTSFFTFHSPLLSLQ
jgi:hypothetical protein